MARRPNALLDITEIIPKFYGGYTNNLDDKGRACIPARLREIIELREMKNLMLRLIYLKSFPLIRAYPAIFFRDNVLPTVSQHNPESEFGVYKMNTMMATCYPVRLDNQGRINIPSDLLQGAHIEKEIKFVGLSDFFDMWHPGTYEQFQEAGSTGQLKQE